MLCFALTTLFLISAFPLTAKAQQGPHVNYTNITTDTTTVVKPAPGFLHSVCLNNPTATTVITLWDNASAASGAKIGTITVPTSPQPVCLRYDVSTNNGLTVQTATATSDITILWE